jgi:hypothetical protein
MSGPYAEELPNRFTCPRCGATTAHPVDVLMSYCGKCHAWAGGMTHDQMQYVHEQVQAEDDQHDPCSCVCCCFDCGPMYAVLMGVTEPPAESEHGDRSMKEEHQ